MFSESQNENRGGSSSEQIDSQNEQLEPRSDEYMSLSDENKESVNEPSNILGEG